MSKKAKIVLAVVIPAFVGAIVAIVVHLVSEHQQYGSVEDDYEDDDAEDSDNGGGEDVVVEE